MENDRIAQPHTKPGQIRALLMQQIIGAVAKASHIEKSILLGEGKSQDVVSARFVVMRIAKREGLGHVRIGRALGGRDHSTVTSGLRAAEKLIQQGGVRGTYMARMEEVATAILAGVGGDRVPAPPPPPSPSPSPSPSTARASKSAPKSIHGSINASGEIIINP
jgi:hypothetical protein